MTRGLKNKDKKFLRQKNDYKMHKFESIFQHFPGEHATIPISMTRGLQTKVLSS